MITQAIRGTCAAALIALTAGPPAGAAGFDHAHSLWDGVLKEYSTNSRVDYEGIIRSPEKFDSYLAQLEEVTKKEEKSWSRSRRLAFWINAYNAFSFKAIIDNYPAKAQDAAHAKLFGKHSIRNIPGAMKRHMFRAAGRSLSLEKIENKILRKELSDPRIHFALVCASISCPPLRPAAYVAKRLDEQLEDNIKGFLSSRENFRLSHKTGRVYLSPILEWFNEDFASFNKGSWDAYPKKARGGLAFLSTRMTTKDLKRLKGRRIKFKWMKYNWGLNRSGSGLRRHLPGDESR